MEVRQVGITPKLLDDYLRLFRACFPQATTFSAEYLHWLYALNPMGNVVGFDAWEDDELAAHYVCIPAHAEINGVPRRLLLSLNTATHPGFQGKGLFTRLAEATYGYATESGFDGVYGVANANSTPGFVRKLGFELVSPLDAKIGVGRLDRVARPEAVGFRRLWDQATLSWRISNPARPYAVAALAHGGIGAWAKTGKPGLIAWDEVDADAAGVDVAHAPLVARLHLGLRPAGVSRSGLWMDVPQRFRSSPLNLIFRPLGGAIERIERGTIRLGQLDFDAF